MEEISFYYLDCASILSRAIDMIAEKRWEECEREDYEGPWNRADERLHLARIAVFNEGYRANHEMFFFIEQSDESELTLVQSERDDCYYAFAGNPDEVLEKIYELAPDDLRLRVLVE